jgi:hypothetical protein
MVIGAGLIVWTLSRSGLPPQLTTAFLCAGTIELALGLGLLARSRVAWSFALSMDGVLVAVGMFALPAIGRVGASALVGGLALATVAGTFGVLVAAKDEF